MSRKRFSSEQIIRILREAEVLQSQGMTLGEVSRSASLNRLIIAGGKTTEA
jgi:hypothetical protein